MQILRQCEDLVKLKIRKDEDNSGMCLRDRAQWPAAGGGWRTCTGIPASHIPPHPASGSSGATTSSPERAMLAEYLISEWLVGTTLAGCRAGPDNRGRPELVSWEGEKSQKRVIRGVEVNRV